MNLKTYAQDYKENGSGAIGLEPNPPENSTDNPLLISAEYLVLMSTLYPEDLTEFVSWWHPLLERHKLESGLYSRQIGVVSTTSQDELIALVAAEYVYGYTSLTKEIYEHLKANYWFWNTEHRSIKGWRLIWEAIKGHDIRRSWMGRFPGLTATVKVAAGYKANWFDIWLAKQAFKSNMKEAFSETSGKKLLYLMFLVLAGHNNGLDAVMIDWEDKMKELYGENYVAGIYGIWYPNNHPNKVFAKVNA